VPISIQILPGSDRLRIEVRLMPTGERTNRPKLPSGRGPSGNFGSGVSPVRIKPDVAWKAQQEKRRREEAMAQAAGLRAARFGS
jgi:hypothetical protein